MMSLFVDNEESVDNRLETAHSLLTASQVLKQLDNSSSKLTIFVLLVLLVLVCNCHFGVTLSRALNPRVRCAFGNVSFYFFDTVFP